MLITVILLSVLSTASIVANFLLWKTAERHLETSELYANWISDWREYVFKTWVHMKMLDEKQMFEKDDEVGVIFEDMKALIESLNDRTEETTNTE